MPYDLFGFVTTPVFKDNVFELPICAQRWRFMAEWEDWSHMEAILQQDIERLLDEKSDGTQVTGGFFVTCKSNN